jgi:hypothetical protein
MGLAFASPSKAMRAALSSLTVDQVGTGRITDRDMAACCLAGAWMVHDFFEESHGISQDIHTAEGSYFHAILHRREPDADNAAYWFRRVRSHPIFQPLARDAAKLAAASDVTGAAWLTAAGPWDPMRFIVLCEKARTGRDDRLTALCRTIAMREFWLLMNHCHHGATRSET